MKSFFLIFVILLNFFTSPWSHTELTTPQQIQMELSEKLLRLHVIAASDSTTDQEIKLLVKDETVLFLKDLLYNCHSKEEAIVTITDSISVLEESLKTFLSSIHCTQTVTISLEYTYFPVKLYGDLVFPAGYYDALRIVLDEGEGQNWWCVLYPPLCFTDVCTMSVPEQSKEQLRETVSDDTWNSLQMNPTSKNKTPKIKFWIVEFITNIFAR